MQTKDFYYELPERLIAQTPLEPRDSSRLLAYDMTNDKTEHTVFSQIGKFLKKGDLLVVNNTRVIPARLFAKKEGSETDFEILLIKRISIDRYEAIMRPARKARVGDVFTVSDELKAVIEGIGEEGIRIIKFLYKGVLEDILSRVGNMPLPPYIKQKLEDKERYQTVYSKVEGSSAAPTAGLHFTVDLIEKLKGMGVEFAEVQLDIGLGTFRPVKCENIEEHKMHSERYNIDNATAEKINTARREGRRVIAVGTTSVRVLESVADENGYLKEAKGDTDIFIYPGYKFKSIDGLITNFHLPESTLIMLVAAFLGREKTLELYNEAIRLNYRFFSFGDSMFIFKS
ncbi:MAG: tRNA preQ1(34) S-adenosylmethionine ribosyltransferase-isomerase QueA [Clostridiales bacterium]|nr:tRNA preQ1(34) S-adenosylmethionine ribosyltransferase-isomerase QueA [Clostridiales bacterium]